MTNTSASAVHRSLIAPGVSRGDSCRGSWRAGPRCRRHRGSGRVFEEAEEPGVGGEHEGCGVPVQRIAISLHRTIEGEEILVLAIGVSIELDALRIALPTNPLGVSLRLREDYCALPLGIGADALRRFGTLAAVLRGLLLTLRLHAGENRLTVFLRQVGAADSYIDDMDAKGFALLADFVADLMHDRRALIRQQSRQRHIAEHAPQAAAHHRIQSSADGGFGTHRLIEQQRIGNAVPRIGIDDEPFLIRNDDFLGWRLEIEKPVLVINDVLDEGPLDLEAGVANDPPRLAKLQDQRLLGLIDDEERTHREYTADDQHDRGD